MGKSKDLASGNSAAYVETAGDTMTGALTVDTATSTNLTVDSGVYGGIQFKVAGTDTGYITSYTNGSGAEAMYIGGADTVNLHTGTNHVLTGGTTRLQIDASGHVTMPNQPVFYGTRATNQTTTGNQDASTPIDFPTSTTIISSTHWNHSNHRFTAPVTGNYMFEWGYATNQIAGQSVYRTFLWKNGSKQAWTQLRNDSNGHTGYNYSSRGALLPLTANDYIHLNSSTDAGYAFYGDSTLRIHLSIFLVG